MNIAYNAALQAATAALAAAGYRASRDAHHYRVIQSLKETIGADASVVTTFDAVPQEAQHQRIRTDRLGF
jgi:hypothetical protein